ncbi:MAG: ral secretion pathway protein [Candidatus Sumerlaeota bacterium]|nr:ral secretion pathway protein [Candidatus Sumerlaeota bacterium]
MRRFSGFTLIELLVVVAIIAILAAIAVPNFLEAMTRAKVSRTKSDLRTLATALETYRIDKNRYPPDSSYGVVPYLERLRHLTTPVAYLSSLPGDPFADKGEIRRHSQANSINPYARDAQVGGEFLYPLAYDYASRRTPAGGMEPDSQWGRIAHNPDAVMWAMRGVGPDRWPAWLGEDPTPYDPTNGTVSTGSIFWTGPGIGPDVPRDLL